MRALLALVVMAATASAQTEHGDYDPQSSAWNGMATFVGLAEGEGYTVTPVTALEWGDLTAQDILVLMYPLEQVEASKLERFVEAGGNVLIADDFGKGKDAMARLGLFRAEYATPKAARYHDGRVWAPIATARADHELTKDVEEVVTNHPAALKQIEGAATMIGFEDSSVVVAGVRGPGKFVAISDPSIFINRMLQFPGNVQLAVNILRWLNRGGRAKHVVLLRGSVPMYGDPRTFIDDPHGSEVAHSVAALNTWLEKRQEWLLTPGAMKALAATLAALLLVLALIALPVRRGPNIDGGWLRFGRPVRRDEPYRLVIRAERGATAYLVVACILRDHAQALLAQVLEHGEPLYTLTEAQLLTALAAARGDRAAAALGGLYRRLRALPSRGQAAAPWSTGQLSRRDFDTLYRDVAELCRTLGAPLIEAGEQAA